MRRLIRPFMIVVLVCGPGFRPAAAQTGDTAPTPSAVAVNEAGPPARDAGTPPADTAVPSNGSGSFEGGWAGRFVKDVGRDYVHFVSKDTAITLGIGGGAALAVHAADSWLSEQAAESNVDLPFGETYGSQWLHIPVAVGWWLVGAAAGSDRQAEVGRDLLRAQISVVSWTYVVKVTTNRTRPNGDPHSFPSGHASTSFATAMVLERHFGWKVGVPAFAAASYVAASRVAANQHWASDVVFGAAVGLASGRTVTVRLRDTRVAVAPLVAPGTKGVLLTVSRSS